MIPPQPLTPNTPLTTPNPLDIQLLPTQSFVLPAGTNTDQKNVYTLTNRATEYICPQILQVYTGGELKAQDIPASLFTDDVKSVIMFRGLEIGEPTDAQTLQTYRDQGIAINDIRFEPDRNVTRAEFVKMLVRSLSCRYTFEGTDSKFSDIHSDAWYAEYITFAVNHGWINGYGDGTFRPDAPISRAEAAKILANAIQLPQDPKAQTSFVDIPKTSTFVPYIEALKSKKIIAGKTKTTYEPDAKISRTEVSRLIYKTFLG